MNDEPTPETVNSTPEETTTVEAEAQAEATSETQKTMPPLTAERVTDITFGLGKAAVDLLDQAARQLDDSVRQIRQDTPSFLADMEEKGRPIREKLSESFKGFNVADVFNKATHKGEGAPGTGPDDFDDIEALENRVRELEQQVSTEPTEALAPPTVTESEKPAEVSPFSMLELDDDPAPVPVAEAKPAAETKPKPARKTAAAKTTETAPKKPAAPRTRKKPEGESAG